MSNRREKIFESGRTKSTDENVKKGFINEEIKKWIIPLLCAAPLASSWPQCVHVRHVPFQPGVQLFHLAVVSGMLSPTEITSQHSIQHPQHLLILIPSQFQTTFLLQPHYLSLHRTRIVAGFLQRVFNS